jgi:hypothetical protein
VKREAVAAGRRGIVWSAAFRRVDESSGGAGSFCDNPEVPGPIGLLDPREGGTPNEDNALRRHYELFRPFFVSFG